MRAAATGSASRSGTGHRRRWRRTATLGVLVGASLALVATPAHAGNQPITGLPDAVVSEADEYLASQAVGAEDLRLRAIQRDKLGPAARKTLVLAPTPLLRPGPGLLPTPRTFTLADIQALAPDKLVKMKDGSYLLSRNIAIMPGATLRLSAPPGGLNLRLSSGPGGFVSIVSLGGKLELLGKKDARLRVSSWDADAKAPDTAPEDGRAYVRAIDGRFTADYVDASALGFWSGRTGGLAVTGNALPKPATREQIGQAPGEGAKVFMMGDVSRGPAGPLQPGQKGPNPDYRVPAPAKISNRIAHTTVTGNAFGLFISGIDGLSISDTKVKESLISGVVLHRYVTTGVVTRTTSNDNAGDGFLLDRATTGITLNQTTANNNALSGFTVSGVPEAVGPTVAGDSTLTYGENLIANSTASGNGKYGIHIVGGSPVGVQNNRVTDTDMGIVVGGPAQRISIIGNQVRNIRRHGIALLDGVSRSTVADNTVYSAGTGIHLRDSVGEVRSNSIQRAGSHGVSLVGQVAGSEVAVNVVSGTGPSALDRNRSTGMVTFSRNQVDGWEETKGPWYLWFKTLLRPTTLIWGMIALLVILTAVRGRKRDEIGVLHPYAHQMAHHGNLSTPARVAEPRLEQRTFSS